MNTIEPDIQEELDQLPEYISHWAKHPKTLNEFYLEGHSEIDALLDDLTFTI